MKKGGAATSHNAMHALVISMIYTCLYAFFLYAEPGPSIRLSMVTVLDAESLLNLVLIVFLIYLISVAVILVFCYFMEVLCDKKDEFADVAQNSGNACCISASIILYLATAFGLISWGGF